MPVDAGTVTAKKLGERVYKRARPPCDVHVLIDHPPGYVLARSLADIPRPAVIVTFNTCVSYLRDVLDLKPEVLLADPVTPEDVRQAIIRAAGAQRFYSGPPLDSDRLGRRERQILRLTALGLRNSDIARRLKISVKTVGNLVSAVECKLGLVNRVDACLYYFGLLHHLRLARAPVQTRETSQRDTDSRPLAAGAAGSSVTRARPLYSHRAGGRDQR
jgi:DNA-binding NarL/FixJ family response regulator